MENPKQNEHYRISEDSKSVELFGHDGSVVQTLDLAGVQRYIEMLGAIRTQMLPGVHPSNRGEGNHPVVTNLWFENISETRPPVEIGCRVFPRSPAFGWLEYQASPSFCQDLMKWLVTAPVANQAPPGAIPN